MTDIVTLDLGDTTGWAALEAGRVRHGIRNFDILLNEHPGKRWPRVRGELRELLRGKRWCVWEVIVNSGGMLAKANLYGIEAQVVEVCAELGVEPMTVAPGTLKKFATCGVRGCEHRPGTDCPGRGNATKEELRIAGRSKWPDAVFNTHDEVDARWILEWAIEQLERRTGERPKVRATRRTT
jgi:hypothetical protein